MFCFDPLNLLIKTYLAFLNEVEVCIHAYSLLLFLIFIHFSVSSTLNIPSSGWLKLSSRICSPICVLEVFSPLILLLPLTFNPDFASFLDTIFFSFWFYWRKLLTIFMSQVIFSDSLSFFSNSLWLLLSSSLCQRFFFLLCFFSFPLIWIDFFQVSFAIFSFWLLLFFCFTFAYFSQKYYVR